MDLTSMLMASGGFWNAWHGVIKYVALAIMAVCALFIVIVVLFQSGNQSGINALNGQQESFYEQNKGKTLDYKLKKLTVITGVIFAVLAIAFAVVSALAAA